MEILMRTDLCSSCKKEKEVLSKRYCRSCSNAYMREWRKQHPSSLEQRKKANIRGKVKMRVKRGTIIRYPCEVCGKEKSEAHHDDYTKPYCVRWLCMKCHREHHKREYENRISVK